MTLFFSSYHHQAMQFFPQQQFAGFQPQAQQCLGCPAYNNYLQQQQQYPQLSALYPQQYLPPQQQQFYYPQQQQQQFYYPQQQQQFYYPQQQYPFSPQQQPIWPQSNWGQNAGGYQQYWPQQQRVYEDPSTPPPVKHQKKGEPKIYYERYY